MSLNDQQTPKPESDKGSPMDEYERFWLRAYRKVGTYPAPIDSGKWMLFIYENEINNAWQVIRTAVEEGRLGETAKVATARPNPNELKEGLKLICVYTYNSEDKDDVLRILQSLRELGFLHSLTYKTDETTVKGEYSFNTSGPVSKYYARKGMVELLTPKGRNKRGGKITARRIENMEQLEEALQEEDFYSSAYFQEIMQRDD